MEETFGEAIRKARESAGLTQSEVASQLNASKGYVSQLETGFRTGITGENLVRLCAALKVPQDYFAKCLAPEVTVPPPPAQEHRCQLVGTIAAGPDDVPTVYDEPEWITFDGPLPKDAYALRVVGNSCERFGISNGDIVAVEPTNTPREGFFCVLGSTGGDWTLKAYSRGLFWQFRQFRPTDPEPVEFMFHDSTRMFGVVIGGKYGRRGYEAAVKKPKRKGK